MSPFYVLKWFHWKGVEWSLEEENTVVEEDGLDSCMDSVGDDKTVEKGNNMEDNFVERYLQEHSFLGNFDKKL